MSPQRYNISSKPVALTAEMALKNHGLTDRSSVCPKCAKENFIICRNCMKKRYLA